ncbi:sensor histidine kinase [Oceanirhabdus seepicola]|uniref:Histidine kinase n=1 Tax=Oceanirhabdus seepicola TaxID=2828781 RepID=A0A9J6NYI2_9CLOT|nr:histidine kinase [Oceanirhabdus seepicola]MCM1988200.1 histidine kinase [Oceanirhabdus seepicola]
MKRFTDFKIRSQIRFIVIIVGIIIIILEMAVVYFIGNLLVDKTKASYEANTKVVEDNISNILNSIKVNNMNYSYVLEISETLSKRTYTESKLEDYFVNGYAKFNSFFHGTMEGIILYPIEGKSIIVGNIEYPNNIFNKIKEQYDLTNKIYNTSFFTESIFEENTEKYYFACVSPIYEPNTKNPKGYFISIINYDFVSNILKINSEKETDTMLLLVENNNIITSNMSIANETFEKIMTYSEEENKSSEYVNIENSKYLYIQKNFKNTNWSVITLIPRNKIIRSTSSLRPIFIGIALVGIAILAVVVRATISAVTKPVEKIVKKLDEYESSEEYEDIETPLKNEISEIAMHINQMMHKVKDSNNELLDTQKTLYELEISMVQAELSYYQSQINPHFLYNTLECIRSLATFYDAEDIEKLSLAMSKIFRYAVKEETVVTLEDELKCVSEYMNVMSLRFPDTYQYVVNLEGGIKEISITKMTLQPIIENCFKHGFTNKKKKGKIYIKSNMYDNYVDLEIIDTGKGISKVEVNYINKSLLNEEEENITNNKGTRVGLKNINKRIKLCFGNEYGIKLESKEGFYTKVILRVPL